MMQKSIDLPKKLRQKVLLKQLIWIKLQKFEANYFWLLPPKYLPRSIMQKAVQLFDSLNHAMISWIACHDNECLIYWSKKENQLSYFSILSGLSASLPLLVSKPEERNNADAIFTPKTTLFKIDPMEDMYRLSKLQI